MTAPPFPLPDRAAEMTLREHYAGLFMAATLMDPEWQGMAAIATVVDAAVYRAEALIKRLEEGHPDD